RTPRRGGPTGTNGSPLWRSDSGPKHLVPAEGSSEHEKGAPFGAPDLLFCSGADDGIRTRDPNLGKVVLYQLSHVRVVRETYQSPAGPGYVGETYWRPVEPNPPWPRVVCPRSSTSSQSMAATSWITSWAMRSPTATSNASAGSWLTRTTRISSR